ncbi:hypothetical protein BGZ68_008417 [Mortierella alpina]|nr:hypothetical protein BGZ68_008417 [Mortierella alpina]
MPQKDINLKTLQLFIDTHRVPMISDVDPSAVKIAENTIEYANILLTLDDDFDYSSKSAITQFSVLSNSGRRKLCKTFGANLKKRPHPELASPEGLQKQLSVDIRLPTELWEAICSYLYPSQLARLLRVSRTLYRLVASMNIWSFYFTHLQGRRSFPLYQHLINKPQHHMHYIISISYQVCDKCTILSNPDSPQKFAAMPLPVLEWPLPRPDQADYYPRPGKIRLCLPCRREHYAVYPEAIPPEVLGRYLPKYPLKEKYFIGEANIKSIKDRRSYEAETEGGPYRAYDDPKGSYYSEQAVLANSRYVYGGDVGIQAYQDEPYYMAGRSEEKRRAFEDQFTSFASAKRRKIN